MRALWTRLALASQVVRWRLALASQVVRWRLALASQVVRWRLALASQVVRWRLALAYCGYDSHIFLDTFRAGALPSKYSVALATT
jgi:hypothetical protein